MIDPKLNELPANAKGDIKEQNLTEEQRLQRAKAGLSINDTIAGNANLSVGSRGVNTSGVDSGAGVGAGTTHVTPAAAGESPAPEFVPGSAKTGTAPQSSSVVERTSVPGVNTATSSSALGAQPSTPANAATSQVNAGTEGLGTTGTNSYDPTRDEIAARAHECWMERGCPEGSSELDWKRAEDELRSGRMSGRKTYAAGSSS